MESKELSVKGQNLDGRFIVIKQSFFGDSYTGSRVARVAPATGSGPDVRDRAVLVEGDDGGPWRLDRAKVERFASPDEIRDFVRIDLRSMKRLLPVHRIHHICWGYGYRLLWSPLAWFDDYGFKWMSLSRETGRLSRGFHNCTVTGVY